MAPGIIIGIVCFGIFVLIFGFLQLGRWTGGQHADRQGCMRTFIVAAVFLIGLPIFVWAVAGFMDRGHSTVEVDLRTLSGSPVANGQNSSTPTSEQESYNDADRRMNDAYKGLLSRLDYLHREKLKREQAQWLSQLKGVGSLNQRTVAVIRRTDDLNSRGY